MKNVKSKNIIAVTISGIQTIFHGGRNLALTTAPTTLHSKSLKSVTKNVTNYYNLISGCLLCQWKFEDCFVRKIKNQK
jgi:hypothetical protein